MCICMKIFVSVQVLIASTRIGLSQVSSLFCLTEDASARRLVTDYSSANQCYRFANYTNL